MARRRPGLLVAAAACVSCRPPAANDRAEHREAARASAVEAELRRATAAFDGAREDSVDDGDGDAAAAALLLVGVATVVW